MCMVTLASAPLALAAGPDRPEAGPTIQVSTANSSVSFFGLGTPGATVLVSGAGFSPAERVELFFDTADQAWTTADQSGNFAKIGLQVPLTAVTGTHWVTAIGQTSQISAQASYGVTMSWTQFHANASLTGLNANENVLSPFTVGALTRRWVATTGGAVTGSMVTGLFYEYVGSADGKLSVYPGGCVTTCPSRWTVTTGGPVTSTPALGPQLVYATSGDGYLYVVNTAVCPPGPCQPVWKGSVGAPISSSPVVSGSVYVTSTTGLVDAFSQGGCGGGSICSPQWSTSVSSSGLTTPAVGFGRLYVGSADGNLYALSPANGQVLWTTNLGSPITAAPAVNQTPWSHPMVYVGTAGGQLDVLDAYNGALQFTGTAGGPIESSPAVADGDVYLGADDGKLYAFSTVKCQAPPCQPVWMASTGGAVVSSPAVADNVVYVGSKDGTLYAYNARSGMPVWSYNVGSPIESSPSVASGFVYVGADNGSVSAFRLPSPPTPPPKPSLANLHPFSSPIRHVVVIYQENQSFDTVLGALCVADVRCDGATTGTLPDGSTIQLQAAPDLIPLVSHDPMSQTTAIDGGKMDGFGLIAGCTSSTNYACYDQYQPGQIPNLAALARSFAISDRTFEMDSVPSWGSHLVLGAAQMDGFIGDIPVNVKGVAPGPPTWGCDANQNATWISPSGQKLSEPSCIPFPDGSGPWAPSPVPWVPTIMDRLDTAGLSWRIYSGWGDWSVCPSFSDCIYTPQRNLALQSPQVITDANSASLPTLSIVIPSGPNSQHNGWSMLQGDNWIGSVVSAIERSSDWASTAILITYDDCGCFYDHVPPPPELGIRVPMVIVSPFARPGFTDSNVASYASMLAYTEHAFGLQPLTTRDANAYDFSASFNYAQAPLSPIPLGRHPVPRWELRWIKAHPPDDTET